MPVTYLILENITSGYGNHKWYIEFSRNFALEQKLKNQTINFSKSNFLSNVT